MRGAIVSLFAGLALLLVTACEKAAPTGGRSVTPTTRGETGRAARGSAAQAAREPGPLRVVVTIAPLAGLVRELVPAGSEVSILMAPGRSEHGYEFTPRELAGIGRADLVVSVGLSLEPKVTEFLHEHPSATRIEVCLADVLEIHAAPGGEAEAEHDDSHAHEHDHGPIDQHLWLDPVLMARAIPALSAAITRAAALPGVVAGPMPNYPVLIAKIEALDADHVARLKPLAGRSIVTHHNAWSRLADRYGLKVAAVLRPIESAEPTPGQVAKCVDAIRGAGAGTIFVEPQFESVTARRVADAAGVRVAVLDPLGTGDWFAMMRGNLDALAGGLGEKR